MRPHLGVPHHDREALMTTPSRDLTTDVVDVLTQDHQEMVGLIDEIRLESQPAARRDLADRLIAELVRHSVAEEMFVYPAMREFLTDGDAAVEHDIAEHQELERTLKALEALDATDAAFDEVLDGLSTTLRDHMDDEERDQFPRLRQSVPAETLQQLADQVAMAKKVAPTRPHPDAPNDALFHMLAGPGIGLVDRLRDRLSGRSTG
jgi:hemerythrin superfamily protein